MFVCFPKSKEIAVNMTVLLLWLFHSPLPNFTLQFSHNHSPLLPLVLFPSENASVARRHQLPWNIMNRNLRNFLMHLFRIESSWWNLYRLWRIVLESLYFLVLCLLMCSILRMNLLLLMLLSMSDLEIPLLRYSPTASSIDSTIYYLFIRFCSCVNYM